MTDKSQRERFEVWFPNSHAARLGATLYRTSTGKYCDYRTEDMWQSALAHPAATGAVDEVTFVEDFRIWACKAAQLMDGFQHDPVWSDWDREVRKELSGLIVRAESIRTASPSQPDREMLKRFYQHFRPSVRWGDDADEAVTKFLAFNASQVKR